MPTIYRAIPLSWWNFGEISLCATPLQLSISLSLCSLIFSVTQRNSPVPIFPRRRRWVIYWNHCLPWRSTKGPLLCVVAVIWRFHPRGWSKNIGLDVSIIGKQGDRMTLLACLGPESNDKHTQYGSTRRAGKSISLFYLLEIYIVLWESERARGDNRLSSRKREDVMCRLSGFIVLTEANWLSEMDHKSIRGVV